MNEEFEFSVFDQLLASGNRQDRQITGDGTDEDWYSWEAEEVNLNAALDGDSIVTVYGDGIDTQKYVVTWSRIT